MRQASSDLERAGRRCLVKFTAESPPNEVEDIGRQIRQVAKRFMLDLPAFTKGPPQEYRGIGLALVRFGNRRDVDASSF